MSNLYRGLSIDAVYQILVHLVKQFRRRRFFRNWPTRSKKFLWQQCVLTARNEMLSEEKIQMWIDNS
jgi:hypothetical protein